MEWVFPTRFQVLDWKFFVLYFDGNVCNWIPKVICPWMYRFLSLKVFVEKYLFRWPHICTDWKLLELFNCFFFLTTSNSFDVYFERCSGLFLKNAWTFKSLDFVYKIFSLSNAKQLYFHLFVSSILCVSLKVLVKLFDYFWKPISPFSKFCVNCLLMFYLEYCNKCAFKCVNGAC